MTGFKPWIPIVRSNCSTNCTTTISLFHFYTFLNGPSSASFLFIFVFSNKHQNTTLCQDSNPQPSEHESPPVTTRPRLAPNLRLFFCLSFTFIHLSFFLSFLLSASDRPLIKDKVHYIFPQWSIILSPTRAQR